MSVKWSLIYEYKIQRMNLNPGAAVVSLNDDTAVVTLFDSYGREHWELVTNYTHNGAVVFVFRRPIMGMETKSQ